MLILATFELLQIREDFLLETNKNTTNNLLIGDGWALLLLRNDVVDILDEDNIGILFIEILDECTMSTRILAASVSVLAFCTEKEILYFTP